MLGVRSSLPKRSLPASATGRRTPIIATRSRGIPGAVALCGLRSAACCFFLHESMLVGAGTPVTTQLFCLRNVIPVAASKHRREAGREACTRVRWPSVHSQVCWNLHLFPSRSVSTAAPSHTPAPPPAPSQAAGAAACWPQSCCTSSCAPPRCSTPTQDLLFLKALPSLFRSKQTKTVILFHRFWPAA